MEKNAAKAQDVQEVKPKPVRRRKLKAEVAEPQPEPKPVREKKAKQPDGCAIAKTLLRMIRKHCMECMGGRGSKTVIKDGRHVVEPDCEAAHCHLYPVMRGEIDYE